ncbi:MAG: leucine--tRNA ligase [Segetibacter sp.]|nr:leucine--tRNA ligase [Segetibacter sp.]
MEYNFREIEKKWQQHWRDSDAYKVSNESDKPKFYVLDMFPYPSGAGLHVGHPLGYIASDIYARFKRLKGFNVLHPMGFDSFGLPAEQYAIETGQHPAVTTEKNIKRYREQLDNIGFCYDWSREVRTSDANYYKWTQWIFLQLFDSWYNKHAKKAERIKILVSIFEVEGNASHQCPGNERLVFTAADWKSYDETSRQDILMNYRLAYSAYGEVNWCEALGTVLANDEVVNGVSERGGHPVEKKKMRQWYLRITEYADRLLQGLEQVDFSESMKDMQKNWIGKSQGAEIVFPLAPASPRRGVEPDQSEEEMPGFGYTNYKVDSEISFENVKRMREEPTEAENILWNAIKNRATGYKFRRQHPIQNYIADFVCLNAWLIVEIDGGYHTTNEQKETDAARDAALKEIGFTTLRFTSEEVTNNPGQVLQKIKVTCDELIAASVEKRSAVGGASPLQGEAGVRVYTTRPDTIFGVDFMVIAPEHELVSKITSPEQKDEIEKYLTYVKSRSERERLAEVKSITGAFTGAYAINPFDGREIPIWISEYVLAGYGTGAIMAVPCGDQRDYSFAKHFNIPITNIIGDAYNGEEANPTKDAILQNSGFIDGMVMREAMNVAINKLEEMGIGKRKVNYRMRDAGFSRQRYWGEPFPIIYKEGITFPLSETKLPVELPYVESYGPGPEGEGPLANIREWVNLPDGARRETNTMPGYAGSSWYFLRYMDPHNEAAFVDRKAADYWGQVDLYIGGTEHAVGHLLYSRLWTKVLFDLGYIGHDEPYKKLVNQGMIQGSSRFIYRVMPNLSNEQQIKLEEVSTDSEIHPLFVSKTYRDRIINGEIAMKDLFHKVSGYSKNNKGLMELFGDTVEFRLNDLHVDVSYVDGVELKVDALSTSKPEFHNALFILEDGKVISKGEEFDEVNDKYICGAEVEKMSKSKYNVVNPDEIVERFGADTFRMYEMFLGPVEQSKPWDTKGIEGVHRFLRKFWRLFVDDIKGLVVTNDSATPAELKVLHKTIKKIEEDTERFSFNTAVSAFMVCVNDLNELKCHKREILEPLVILLTPYAPHIAEELYQELLKTSPAGRLEGVSVLDAAFPNFEEKYLVESSKEYPISINGKLRTNLNISLDAAQPEVEQLVLANEIVRKWLDGKPPKKIIFVKNKMINVVI